MKVVTIALLLVVIPLAARAQSQPSPSPAPESSTAPADPCTTTLAVVTRPSVTTSPCAVKAKHVVIETGYQNTTPDGGTPVAMYPQALIRFGTTVPNLEVSVAPPSVERSRGTTGSSDTAFGAKYELGYSSKWLYGVNAVVTLPTGLGGYSAGGTGYTANLDLSYALTPGLSLATTVGYNSLSDGNQRYTSIIPSLVLSSMLTANTAFFGEVATFSHALGPGGATRTQYLVGLQQSLANALQFDIEAGRSPTTAAGRYRYIGAGLSYAF